MNYDDNIIDLTMGPLPIRSGSELTAEQLLLLERLKHFVMMDLLRLRNRLERASLCEMDSPEVKAFKEFCGPRPGSEHLGWKSVGRWLSRQLFQIEQEVQFMEDFAIEKMQRERCEAERRAARSPKRKRPRKP